MNITVIGRGNVGGGLGRRWTRAGHHVTELGHDGGDASSADAVLLAVPSNAIGEALGKVTGLEGKVVIDATNAFHGRNEDFESLAHEVKSHVSGPVAKAFNCNIATIYNEIDNQRVRPSNFYCGEEGAVAVTEQLSLDAGYEPVSTGGLGSARMQEDHLAFMMAVSEGGLGQFFYRYSKPGEL